MRGALPIGRALGAIGVGDGEIQTMAIEQRRDNPTVKIFPRPAAVVRLGAPSRDRFVAVPVAL